MKIYRVELLVIDYDGLSPDRIKSAFETAGYPNCGVSPDVMSIEGREIGEWQDSNPLNYKNTRDAEYARLFEKTDPHQV